MRTAGPVGLPAATAGAVDSPSAAPPPSRATDAESDRAERSIAARPSRPSPSRASAAQRRAGRAQEQGARLDPTVPALLLRLDWNPAHHATLGVIRSLGRAGVPVHAILEHSRVPAARSRYLAGGHPWLGPPGEPDRLIDLLGRLAERMGADR